MPVELASMETADVPTFVAILNAALFTVGIGRHLQIQPPTAASIAKTEAEILEAMQTKPKLRYLKAVDTDTGEMISGAKWEVLEQGRSPEEIEALSHEPVPSEEERELCGAAQIDFFGHLNRSRQAMGSKPHYLLHLLATHPNHYRRGAGGILLRWGTEKADEAGLLAYLEATEAGRPLYERHDFQVISTMDFDLSKYGGQGIERGTVMTREPRNSGQASDGTS